MLQACQRVDEDHFRLDQPIRSLGRRELAQVFDAVRVVSQFREILVAHESSGDERLGVAVVASC